MKERKPDQPILEYALEVLNDASFHDRIAIEDLLNFQVYCDDGIGKSRITPFTEDSGRKRFGALGLVNAIVKEVSEDGNVRQIAKKIDNYQRLMGFEIVSSKEQEEAREQAMAQRGFGRMKTPKEQAEERKKQQAEREKHYAQQGKASDE